MEFRVTVAILNWNGKAHLETFLPSVVAYSPEAHLCLVDNASTDESVSWTTTHYPRVEIIQLDSNYGFTEGYNRSIPQIKTPFVVLLNSDVEVAPGWLQPLLERMESIPNLAAVQPKILSYKDRERFEYAGAAGGFIDNLAYPFCRGRYFDFCEKDHHQYDQARPIFWASGACMMLRVADFMEAGGFEPRFFAHMEEIDLCWRFQMMGKEVWAEPKSVVYHLGAGTLSASSPRKTLLNFRNGICLLFINTTDFSIWFKLPLRLILDGIAGLRFIVKGDLKNCLAIVKAHFSFYGTLGYWVKKRKENQKRFRYPIKKQVHYSGSIVFDYFVRGCRRFEGLRF